jgi:hypothetical protein
MNCHIDCGYNLARSLSICHKIPSILVTAFRVFVNLTGSRLHLHIHRYQVPSQPLPATVNITSTISPLQPSHSLTLRPIPQLALVWLTSFVLAAE